MSERPSILTTLERGLGSTSVSALCFGGALVALDVSVWAALPLMVVYANYTTKIEQIHARMPAIRSMEKGR